MIDIPLWQGLLLMLPLVFATALVSSCMRFEKLSVALLETVRLSSLIFAAVVGLSALAFSLHLSLIHI